VEVWGKDLIMEDRIGNAITDATDSFRITLDRSYFQERCGVWLRVPVRITDRNTLSQTMVRKNPQ
jgi:hypothetical protein